MPGCATSVTLSSSIVMEIFVTDAAISSCLTWTEKSTACFSIETALDVDMFGRATLRRCDCSSGDIVQVQRHWCFGTSSICLVELILIYFMLQVRVAWIRGLGVKMVLLVHISHVLLRLVACCLRPGFTVLLCPKKKKITINEIVWRFRHFCYRNSRKPSGPKLNQIS